MIDSPQPETGSLIAHVQFNSANDIFPSSDTLQEVEAKVLPELPNASVVTVSIFSWCQRLPSRAKTLASNGCPVIPITNTCNKAVKAVGGSTLIYICK